MKRFCEEYNIPFEFEEKENEAKVLTIDTALNAYLFVYKRPGKNKKTTITYYTDWDENEDEGYVGKKQNLRETIEELYFDFLYDSSKDYFNELKYRENLIKKALNYKEEEVK